jgi:hypothetical protein
MDEEGLWNGATPTAKFNDDDVTGVYMLHKLCLSFITATINFYLFSKYGIDSAL